MAKIRVQGIGSRQVEISDGESALEESKYKRDAQSIHHFLLNRIPVQTYDELYAIMKRGAK